MVVIDELVISDGLRLVMVVITQIFSGQFDVGRIDVSYDLGTIGVFLRCR